MKRITSIPVLLIALCALFLSSCTNSDCGLVEETVEEVVIFRGITKTTYGDVVPGARVSLQTKADVSDADGNYFFSGLHPEKSHISVSKDGFEKFQEDVFIDKGEQTYNIGLKLEPLRPEFEGDLSRQGEIEKNMLYIYPSSPGILKFNLNKFVNKKVSKALLHIGIKGGSEKKSGDIVIYSIPASYNWSLTNPDGLTPEKVVEFPVVSREYVHVPANVNHSDNIETFDLTDWFISVCQSFDLDNGLIVRPTSLSFNTQTVVLEVE